MMILMCWFLVGNRIGMGLGKVFWLFLTDLNNNNEEGRVVWGYAATWLSKSQSCVKHRLAKAIVIMFNARHMIDVDAVRRSSPRCGENGHRSHRSVPISITYT